MKVAFPVAALALLASSAVAFSPNSSSQAAPATRINYRTYDDVVDIGVDVWQDVDGDRTSLSYLLEPPALPLMPLPPPEEDPATTDVPSKKRSSRAIQPRKSPVQSIRTLQDYRAQVLQADDALVVVRFQAPWCRVCKLTNVAFVRMASKLSSASGGRIKFVSVDLDGKDETAQLKEMAGIEGVPAGIVHDARRGTSGRVNLGRANQGLLKKRLESLVENDIAALDVDALVEGLASAEAERERRPLAVQ